MGGHVFDTAGDRRVRVAPGPRASAIAAAVVALGWTVVDADAPVTIVDLAADSEPLDQASPGAVLALSNRIGATAGREAFERGATHWLGADHGAADLAVALDLAARHARRLARAPGFARRADDDPGAEMPTLAAWIAERRGAPIAIAVIRLSRFEFVNAAFGRGTGDALIAAAEARVHAWREALDRPSLVCRDGAEFVVAVAADAAGLADALPDLEAALATPFVEDGASVSLGVRVGVAAVDHDVPFGRALAAARRGFGAARAQEPEPPLDRLAADLHRGIERGEVQVRFQPQAVVATGAIVGVEALARWRHPTLGELGAATLLAAAERAGLSVALSGHIHDRAFQEAARWSGALARLRVSINVTAQDLARSGFAAGLLDRIAAAGLARGRVTVEIVETELVDDLDDAAAILARLRGAGLRTAIDDFGTGYSSLAYLKRLPIDYLKIDRSLTQDIAGSERDRAVVRGVIAIARSLGLGTIAEGVETEPERALLAAEGCDLYQGFLCAGALDSDALAVLIGDDHL